MFDQTEAKVTRLNGFGGRSQTAAELGESESPAALRVQTRCPGVLEVVGGSQGSEPGTVFIESLFVP